MNHYTEQGSCAGRRRLHCPHCRGEQLIAVSEAGETVGFATHNRISRKTGMTTYSASSVNRHYWMCRECGHKFRNLEDLNAELEKNTRITEVNKKLTVVFGIAVLISLLTLILAGGLLGFLMIFVMLFATVLLGVALGLWISSQMVVKKLTPEKAYLEQRCFD